MGLYPPLARERLQATLTPASPHKAEAGMTKWCYTMEKLAFSFVWLSFPIRRERVEFDTPPVVTPLHRLE